MPYHSTFDIFLIPKLEVFLYNMISKNLSLFFKKSFIETAIIKVLLQTVSECYFLFSNADSINKINSKADFISLIIIIVSIFLSIDFSFIKKHRAK